MMRKIDFKYLAATRQTYRGWPNELFIDRSNRSINILRRLCTCGLPGWGQNFLFKKIIFLICLKKMFIFILFFRLYLRKTGAWLSLCLIFFQPLSSYNQVLNVPNYLSRGFLYQLEVKRTSVVSKWKKPHVSSIMNGFQMTQQKIRKNWYHACSFCIECHRAISDDFASWVVGYFALSVTIFSLNAEKPSPFFLPWSYLSTWNDNNIALNCVLIKTQLLFLRKRHHTDSTAGREMHFITCRLTVMLGGCGG